MGLHGQECADGESQKSSAAFQELVRGLTSVFEGQEARIRHLCEENATLRQEWECEEEEEDDEEVPAVKVGSSLSDLKMVRPPQPFTHQVALPWEFHGKCGAGSLSAARTTNMVLYDTPERPEQAAVLRLAPRHVVPVTVSLDGPPMTPTLNEPLATMTVPVRPMTPTNSMMLPPRESGEPSPPSPRCVTGQPDPTSTSPQRSELGVSSPQPSLLPSPRRQNQKPLDSVQQENTIPTTLVDGDTASEIEALRGISAQPSVQSASDNGNMIPDLWPEWTQTATSISNVVIKTGKVRGRFLSHCSIEDLTGEAMSVTTLCIQKLVVSPNSMYRLAWDLLSALLVGYDIVTIPLLVLYLDDDIKPDENFCWFQQLMDKVTLLFWTLDMPWSCLTGFHADGVVEMRMHVILKHYLKTWFSFDFMVLVIEWTSLIMQNYAGAQFLGFMRIGKTARFLRITRTIRLLRFIKVHDVLSEFMDLMNTCGARTTFNIIVALIFTFLFSHYLACGWYLVGHIGYELGDPNWLESNGILERTTSYAYVTALHWSLCQFTPGGMEVRPYNVLERVYSVFCLNCALVAFSSFLGSITASITEWRNHSRDASQQEFLVRKYLSRNNVSYRLSRRIWRFLKENHFKHQKRSGPHPIPTLRLLPPHLFNALYQELYGPYITRAPFFCQYTSFCKEGLVDVCTKGITETSLIRGESLFIEGRVAEKMFFTASGTVHYDHANSQYNLYCDTGAWISEAVLWVRWVHVATLYASTTCEFIELDAATFRNVMEVFKRSLPFVKSYARCFHEYMETKGVPNLTDVMTDVEGLQQVVQKAWKDVSKRNAGITKDISAADYSGDSSEFPMINNSSRFGGFWEKLPTGRTVMGISLSPSLLRRT